MSGPVDLYPGFGHTLCPWRWSSSICCCTQHGPTGEPRGQRQDAGSPGQQPHAAGLGPHGDLIRRARLRGRQVRPLPAQPEPPAPRSDEPGPRSPLRVPRDLHGCRCAPAHHHRLRAASLRRPPGTAAPEFTPASAVAGGRSHRQLRAGVCVAGRLPRHHPDLTAPIDNVGTRRPRDLPRKGDSTMTATEIPDDTGIVTKLSPRSVTDTVSRLIDLVAARGMKLFAVIDQSAEARQAGLELRETTLVMFGSPAAGTPVRVAARLAALDLPLKVVVWADGEQTEVSYLAPSALAARYHLSAELAGKLAGINPLTDALVAL